MPLQDTPEMAGVLGMREFTRTWEMKIVQAR